MGITFTQSLGQSALLLWMALTAPPDRMSREFRRLVTQLYFIGVNSVLIVMLSGLFIGMVLALQGHTGVDLKNAQQHADCENHEIENR